MSDFTHYLLTRYDYPADYPHWRQRLELFRAVTLPSVAAQTTSNFRWIVKTRHPEIIDLLSQSPRVTCSETFAFYPQTEWCITTRLDNDDVIAPEFMQRIQNCFRERTEVIDSIGVRYNAKTGQCVKFDYYTGTRCSPFVSLIERSSNRKTVMHYKHGSIGEHYDVRRIDYTPQWCQVIHETNKLMRWKPGYEAIDRPSWVPYNNETGPS